ncbi:Predicted PurR-regulated permease PerM [Rhizobiales bacterium GAS191]|nr:Predicted PurR-regulated permease PerM [Rhizobiales bacterium GAS191]
MSDPVSKSLRPPAHVQAAETPSLKTLLTLAFCVVIVAGLYLGREMLVPITLAVLLSFVLAPLVNLLRRLRLGRVPSVLLSVVLALGIVLALGGMIGNQLTDLAQQAPRYQTTILQKIEAARSMTLGRMSSIVRRLGRQLEPTSGDRPSRPPARSADSSPGPDQKPLPVEVHQPEPTPLELAERILLPVVSPLSSLAIVFVVAIFVLLQREDLRDRLIRLFGSRDLHRTTTAMNDAADRLSRYFLTQLGINAAFGVVTGVGLSLIGVPSPALWGVLGALLRFVPYVGAVLSAVLPMALAAAVDPGWTMLAWTAALYLVVELLTGQAIEPLLYGHSTGLSPISVVVAATFWTWLWGPTGLILSTPLTLCLVVLGRHVDRLEFLDVILGDRPALTPIENFYQRMLADDPDEALDQAELFLKERSLSSYYDEVAVKGLQLAANDVQRGVLGPEQLDGINEAINAVIQDLSSHEGANPRPEKDANENEDSVSRRAAQKPSEEDLPIIDREHLAPTWRAEAPVLCVAGRGPLDEAASSMLAQLLAQQGLGARTVPHEALSRSGIATFDFRGVAMVCVIYLEISGSPSHLRYLIRRLRQALPGAPILVGLWAADDAATRDERLRATIGVDYYVCSLRQAVAACLKEAQRESQPMQQPTSAIDASPPLVVIQGGQQAQ